MTRQQAVSELQRLSDTTAYYRGFAPESKTEQALKISIRELRAIAKPKRRVK